MDLISHSAEETVRIGEKIAKKLKKGSIVALYGEFGAGKTVFVKGIAKALKCTEIVKSPGFVFVHKYKGIFPLYHIDLYRVNSVEDIINLGIDEFFYKNGVCVIEWAEKAKKELPPKRIDVKFKILNKKSRELKIYAHGFHG